MYKIIIIAEPQKKIVVNLIDLNKEVIVNRTTTYQPQLIGCLKAFVNAQEVNQISVCGPKIYTTKIANDMKEQFPQTKVEEIN